MEISMRTVSHFVMSYLPILIIFVYYGGAYIGNISKAYLTVDNLVVSALVCTNSRIRMRL